MIGLAGIGAALILGIGMRIAAAGSAALVLMWTAVLPPENNVFMDDHLIYAILIVGLALVSQRPQASAAGGARPGSSNGSHS